MIWRFYGKKSFGSFFGHILVGLPFDPKAKFSPRGVHLSWKIDYYPIFAKKCSRDDLLTSRFQLRRFLLKSTLKFWTLSNISHKGAINFMFLIVFLELKTRSLEKIVCKVKFYSSNFIKVIVLWLNFSKIMAKTLTG